MKKEEFEKAWLRSFSIILDKKLKEIGINDSELALKTGLSNTLIHKYHHGQSIPKATSLILICNALDMPISDFVKTLTITKDTMTRREYALSKGITRFIGIENMDALADDDFKGFIDMLVDATEGGD